MMRISPKLTMAEYQLLNLSQAPGLVEADTAIHCASFWRLWMLLYIRDLRAGQDEKTGCAYLRMTLSFCC